MTENNESQGRTRPRKQLSCQNCRKRKVRCERPEGTELFNEHPSESNPLPTCLTCIATGADCQTVYERRKRGPLPGFTRSSFAPGSGSNARPRPSVSPVRPSLALPAAAGPSFNGISDWALPTTAHVSDLESPYSGSSKYPLGLQDVTSPLLPRPSSNDPRKPNPSIAGTPWLIEAPPPVLETILSRDIAVYIVSLYFEYVHPLIPCIHQPTFLERLRNKEDQTNPLFFSLLMSVLASSIVQIPKSHLPFTDEPLLHLAERCNAASRIACQGLHDPPTLEMVTIRYFDAVFFSLTKRPGAWAGAFGQCTRMAIQLELHREAAYEGLGPLETEMRRRLFYTCFLGDKSAACMQQQLIMLRKEDCDVEYFKELDDEYITPTHYLTPPEGKVSRLAGHKAVVEIFAVIGELVTIRRSVALQTVTPSILLNHLRHINNLSQRLIDIHDNLPGPLRLETAASPVNFDMHPNATDSWEAQALFDLNRYLNDMVATSAPPIANESFLVMQGNLHVTRAIARLLVITCREDVMARSGIIGSASRIAAERVVSYSYETFETKETVISDLLYALKRIPMQALAVNSHSLLNKVRFVAVTLLDPVTEANGQPQTEEAQGKQAALLSFLTILSEIEQNLVETFSSH